ncbi:tyrosine-type recombinase/integrase [Candidatus Micrarchaeota archaeon]|nr:tyrosine-type recombinase/integrase [Candidatus Micrarchaeota archaeon]
MGPMRFEESVFGSEFSVSGEKDGFSGPGSRFPDCTQEHSPSAREISRHLSRNWPQIKRELEFLSRHLAKWNLVKAIGVLSAARKSRFLRSRKPKYGSMNKGFTEEELERFFSVVDCPKMHLIFSFQAILGLRIGEAIRLNIKDLNLRTRELRIFTEKSGKTDYLRIPETLFDTTLAYISDYEKEISASQGFLFFSLEPGNRVKKPAPHLTTNTVRTLFHKYVRKAGLEEIYGYSAGGRPKPLFRFSPHSLRHYSITNFCRKNGGNVALASKFARHTNLQVTMTYIHSGKEELYSSIERAHNQDILNKIRRIQEQV